VLNQELSDILESKALALDFGRESPKLKLWIPKYVKIHGSVLKS